MCEKCNINVILIFSTDFCRKKNKILPRSHFLSTSICRPTHLASQISLVLNPRGFFISYRDIFTQFIYAKFCSFLLHKCLRIIDIVVIKLLNLYDHLIQQLHSVVLFIITSSHLIHTLSYFIVNKSHLQLSGAKG